MRVLIFDADTLVWAVAYNNRDEQTPDKMYTAIDNMLSLALRNTKADKYCGFIQGRDNSHRHKLFQSYKANRPPKPEWFTKWKPDIERYLTNPYGRWKFEFVEGMEVDDAVASVVKILEEEKYYSDRSSDYTPIICSIDKDLKQIPGKHYNPEKKEMTIVSEQEALHNLCRQILMGDSIDGIKGLKGVGKVKAERMLKQEDGQYTPEPWLVLTNYILHHKSSSVGMLSFSENAIQVILKQDPNFQFKLNNVTQDDTIHNTAVDSDLRPDSNSGDTGDGSIPSSQHSSQDNEGGVQAPTTETV